MDALAFVKKWQGQSCQSAGGIGGECVDLANQYLAEVWRDPHEFKNAVDWAGIPIAGMRWVANGPTNHPPMGSLVVWRVYPPYGIGANGHIALALASAPMLLLSLDQNWNGQRYCTYTMHDYGGVLGWHQPAG